MSMAHAELLSDPDAVRLALTPVRRDLLERLRTPASATQLAAELDLPRQRVNYHLRALEQAGLVELVEERARRGCTERILRARATTFVVDPSVVGTGASANVRDRFAAEHLVATASDVVRDVVRMQAAAERDGRRLLTFTVEADVRFAQPSDVERFTDALVAGIASLTAEYDTPDGRPYRITVGGHPAPSGKKARRRGTS